MNTTTDHDGYAETERLLRTAVDCALATEDFPAALDHFRRSLPEAAPTFGGALPDDDARRAMAFALLREVWKVLPRPDRGWRPLPAPKPERNAPCPCGSGRKFKQCCGQAANLPAFGEGLSVLGYVLERLPVGHFADLPFKLLSPEEIAHVAAEWMEQDRLDEAVALLEPLLANPAGLDARHEHAFDLLCDAYLGLGRDGDRRALVDAMMGAQDRELRSAAMHRRCTLLADEGDYPGAWQLFGEAQRADPDNPSLAHLELVLLASQGEIDRLATRARFWAARLRRLGYEGEPLVDFVDEVASNPEAFAQAIREHGDEAFDTSVLTRLADLTASLPEPVCHYRLETGAESAGPLTPDGALSEVERGWREHSGFANEACWSATGWLDWLAAHPLAWQSFAVLEDIVLALDDVPFDDAEDGALPDETEDALLDQALRLLRRVIADNRADGLKLEWGWMENRAALSLLARRIEIGGEDEDELPLLEWMVVTLNPSDNHGFREYLVHAYAAAGRPADALGICDRYPDDALGAMLYGRVLALVLLDRRGEAAAALAEAKKSSPRILKTLTAARPKAPADMQPGMVTLGGEDEAWIYRQRWRGVWESTGAMDWLKRAAGARN